MKEVKTGTRKKGELSRSKKKKLGVLFTWLNVQQKGKTLETLCCGGMIRNVMYLRMQRGRSKLIRILLVSIA